MFEFFVKTLLCFIDRRYTKVGFILAVSVRVRWEIVDSHIIQNLRIWANNICSYSSRFCIMCTSGRIFQVKTPREFISLIRHLYNAMCAVYKLYLYLQGHAEIRITREARPTNYLARLYHHTKLEAGNGCCGQAWICCYNKYQSIKYLVKINSTSISGSLDSNKINV